MSSRRCSPLSRAFAGAALALLVSGCGAQVDRSYPGEPLFELRGQVKNAMTTTPTTTAHATLLWHSGGGHDVKMGEYVEVANTFPSSFTLDVYLPPPSEVLLDFSGERMALAFIAATDAALENIEYADDKGVLGLAEQYVLVYIEKDLAEGSRLATLLHSAPKAGYHLYQVVSLTDAEHQAMLDCWDAATTDQERQACGSFDDRLMPADAAATISIRLVDDYDDMDVPCLDHMLSD